MLIQFRKKKKKRTETVEEIIPKWNKEITGQKREDSRKEENKVMSIREKNRKGSGYYAKFPPWRATPSLPATNPTRGEARITPMAPVIRTRNLDDLCCA